MRESELRFRFIFESVVDGVLVADIALKKFIFCNEVLCRMTGYNKEELKKLGVMDLHPEEDLPFVINQFEMQARGEIELCENIPVKRKDGSVFYADINSSSVKVDGTKVLVGTFRDITERKRSEEELRKVRDELEQRVKERTSELELANKDLHERETLYRHLVESAKATPWKLDIDTFCFTYIGPQAVELLGYPEEAWYENNFWEGHLHPDDRDRAVRFCQKKTEAGEDHEFEYRMMAKDGRTVWIRDDVNIATDDKGKTFLQGFMYDISERKESEENLNKMTKVAKRASKAKSEFLANMSHEIRTPMSSVLGMAELLSETALNNQQSEFVDRLTKSGDSLVRLIDDILDLSKVEAGLIELEEINFSLAEEIDKILSLFDVKADKKGIKLKKEISPTAPEYLLSDPIRLRQIFVNLVGNAIKFTESGEVKILVECGEPPESSETCSLLISIIDTGIGIPEHKLDKIFESFSQGDSSITRTHGGTGLGLAISRKLVDLMGGALEVESKEGEGCRFFFTLNMKIGSRDEDLDKGQTSSLTEEKGKALRILLAEDAEDNRLLVKNFLKDTPHTLDMAKNGEEAIEMYTAGKYDLALMDMQMPVMDGYTATRVIRGWEDRNKKVAIPIIAFTAHALKEEVQRCLDAGCTDHLAKPIKKKRLIEVIHSYSLSKS